MKNYRFWTTSEIKTLESGLIPQGRTLTACRRLCSHRGLKFPGKKTLEFNRQLLDEIERRERIAKETQEKGEQ